ncbi:MAG: DNA-3-methyladenine glycosylase I [Neomegalonema sp.]|nr:DNA-3-methyladenine glycosylase I [Neomegalonema sp.]
MSDTALGHPASDATRCPWCGDDPLYTAYHDNEWGRPVGDDRALFEKICLEGFQAGLSWITILRKREGFRAAFANFDMARIARFTEEDVARLLADPAIIRHQGKIRAVINNAPIALRIIEEKGSLAAHLWGFEPDKQPPAPATLSDVPTETAESAMLAKDLRKRGWRFFGPTTAYAFMQSMGFVNDHLADCATRAACEEARTKFERPV